MSKKNGVTKNGKHHAGDQGNVTQTGDVEAFTEEPTQPLRHGYDLTAEDIRNLGFKFSALGQRCAEAARSLDGAHFAERLFVLRQFRLAIGLTEEDLKERGTFLDEIIAVHERQSR